MKLPTEKECYALFQQYHVPSNILAHCEAVRDFALGLAVKLKNKGLAIDVELVRIGGLMHDWMKVVIIKDLPASSKFDYKPTEKEIEAWRKLRKRFEGKHECEAAYDLLKNDYPELASFILREGLLSENYISDRNWEEKIIHYADRRFIGTRLVSLKERLDYIYENYVKGTDVDWQKMKAIDQKNEKEIMEKL